jgi:hypothetical protein
VSHNLPGLSVNHDFSDLANHNPRISQDHWNAPLLSLVVKDWLSRAKSIREVLPQPPAGDTDSILRHHTHRSDPRFTLFHVPSLS